MRHWAGLFPLLLIGVGLSAPAYGQFGGDLFVRMIGCRDDTPHLPQQEDCYTITPEAGDYLIAWTSNLSDIYWDFNIRIWQILAEHLQVELFAPPEDFVLWEAFACGGEEIRFIAERNLEFRCRLEIGAPNQLFRFRLRYQLADVLRAASVELGWNDFVMDNFRDAFTDEGRLRLSPILTANDLDHDTVADALDNCPDAANLDQADADGDGVGDACEIRVPRVVISDEEPVDDEEVEGDDDGEGALLGRGSRAVESGLRTGDLGPLPPGMSPADGSEPEAEGAPLTGCIQLAPVTPSPLSFWPLGLLLAGLVSKRVLKTLAAKRQYFSSR